MSNRSLGTVGEQVAFSYLVQHGYTVVAKNIRIGGVEIDLIVKKGQNIHIVEVKKRTSSLFGGFEEAIDRRKMRRLMRAASVLVAQYSQCTVQIDVIFISTNFPLQHLQNIEIS
ncbi:MAG: YraN family protein [Candidatus Pacebacteria bacterium]|nr:YraN family protein [Candidatus Paceibacterota bacterium]